MSYLKGIILVCLVAYLSAMSPKEKAFYEELKAKADFQIYTPEEYPFRDYTEEELDGLVMKNIKREDLERGYYKYLEEHRNEPEVEKLGDVPASYDFRKSYANCVFPVRNQGGCGSCWGKRYIYNLNKFFASFWRSYDFPTKTLQKKYC